MKYKTKVLHSIIRKKKFRIINTEHEYIPKVLYVKGFGYIQVSYRYSNKIGYILRHSKCFNVLIVNYHRDVCYKIYKSIR